MTEFEYQAELDGIWRRLRPHLEWAQGFKLAILFSSHPAPVQALLQRVRDILALNTLPLRRIVLENPQQLQTVLNAVLAARPLGSARPPLWLDMRLDSTDPEQGKALWQILSRLNERRFLLERDVACPLVLILPSKLRINVPGMLPDLWSIRSFTADLPAPPAVTATIISNIDNGLPELSASREVTSEEIEWQRLWESTEDKQRLSADAAFAAIDSALARMDYAAANEIIDQILPVLRQIAEDEQPNALRNLSIGLDFAGQLHETLGHWQEARAAYAESLGLARQLREALGDTPQSLRDVSVSLDNMGRVEQALGNWEAARAAYAECLGLARQLREALGDTPQSLRDVSVSLEKIGGVEQALGNWEAARAAYAESEAIGKRLVQAYPDVPLYANDLAWVQDRLQALDEDSKP